MEIQEPYKKDQYGYVFPVWVLNGQAKSALYEMIPELKNFDEIIHIIYAGVNAEFSLIGRDTESVLQEVMESYKSGKRFFVFDGTSEALYISIALKINDIACELKNSLPDAKFVYVCSIKNSEETLAQVLKEHNKECFMNIIGVCGFEYVCKNYNYNKKYEIRDRQKKFTCFNRVPRQHRTDLLEYMYRYNLVDQAYYSYYGDTVHDKNLFELAENKLNEYNNHEPPREGSYFLKNFIQYKSNYPLKLNITTERNNPVDVVRDDYEFYENSYFSVITETNFYNFTQDPQNIESPSEFYHDVPHTRGLFLSEKIFKPIVMQHPFILAGQQHILKYLKARGYKTFSPYFDESYDDIKHGGHRLQAIAQEINRLCGLSNEEWLQIQEAIKPILEHNRKNLHASHSYLNDPDINTIFNS